MTCQSVSKIVAQVNTVSVKMSKELHQKAKMLSATLGLKLQDVIDRGVDLMLNSKADPRATLKIPRGLHRRLKKFAKANDKRLNPMVSTWLAMCIEQHVLANKRGDSKK